MNKKIIWLSALALSMSVSQATLACGCKDASVSSHHFEHMTKKLELTADQTTKIKAIKLKAREEMKPKFEQMREIRMQLNTLAGAKELDQPKIDQLIDQKKEIMGSIMKMRVAVKHEIMMLLTDSQKAKMDKIYSEWNAKHYTKD